MRISEFAIRNYPFTIVVFALMVALGWSAWKSIPRTEDPYFPVSAFQIVAVYPGADPLEVERQVIEPIEDTLHGLDDVKEIVSTADDSLGFSRVEFEAGVDVDKKYDEVSRSLAALRPSLPAGIARLEIRKINPGLVNIVQLALVSESASDRLLEDTAQALEDRLDTVAGVRTVATWGAAPRELRVELDLARLAALNIGIAQVYAAISGDNTNVPGGPVEAGARRFNIKTTGSYQSLEQIRDTVIGGSAGREVRVGDVADVRWDAGAVEYQTRLDGKRALFVTANQKDNQNIFVTQAAIEAELEAFAQRLPAGIELVRGFDQSRNVDRRLSRLGHDFVIAILLVSVTLLPLGLRAAGIVMVSIPLSLLVGLAALNFLGFSLNQLSIAGFVVALGLLVDDSIVVTENIERFLRMGYSRMEAAIKATQQIALAVVGCTAALLFAFVPLLALPGNSGKYIMSLPVAVTVTVSASLLVSLTIIPFLASRLLPQHVGAQGNAVLRWLNGGIERFYAPILQKALARPKATALLSLAMVIATFALVPVIGKSLFPKADTPQALIEVSLPNGTSLARTDEVLRLVDAELAKHPEVQHRMANLGRGNPQVYYNVFQREYAANYAEVFLQLTAYDPASTPQLFDQLRKRFDDIPGAEIVVREFQNGVPIAAPIALRVVGPDLDVLRAMAAKVEEVMRTTPGTRNVNNPQRRARLDLKLDFDPAKAGLLGVAPLDFDRAVRLAVAGLAAGQFREQDGDSYPIVLRAPIEGRATLDALDGLHVPSVGGAQVPLAQLADLRLSESPSSIGRYNRERVVTLTAYPETGFNTEAVTQAIVDQLQALDWPDGYSLGVSGEVQSRKDSFKGFGAAILLAVFGILAVLVLEFGSFKSTLIVGTVVPLGLMGGLLALFLSGYSISFTAMIGFIALIGIEIKNSILLVDFINQLRAEGKPLDEAIIEAGEIRFLPILLTSVTAIGGLLPLALQNSGLYSPTAWVIIGGLVSSTLVGRLVTPVMYKLLPPPVTQVGKPAPVAIA